jgi:protein kinase A
MHIDVYVHIYLFICTYICIYTYIYIDIQYLHIYVYSSGIHDVQARFYACIYIFICMYINMYIGVPDIQAKFYASGIILAIGYLHKKDIAYRDLKPENCVIDKAGYPKIIDFGFAKKLPGGVKTYTLCGTPEYLAPELVLGRGHNKAVDYWAFGILIYEMLAGFSPFSDAQGMDQVVTCRNIVNGRLSFPRTFGAECKDLVKKLLVREIQNRLGKI